jgi:hypothetical protein
VADGGQGFQVHVGRQRHPAAVDLEESRACRSCRGWGCDLPVESGPAGAARGSRALGMLVAPMTMTRSRLCSPSSRPAAAPHPLLHVADHALARGGAMASISSRKTMLGLRLAASSKILRRWASLSPVDLWTTSGPLNAEEAGGRSRGRWSGRRISVLPVPGGPCSSTPLGGVDSPAGEDLGVAQRQLDHLADALQLRLEPADGPRRTRRGRAPPPPPARRRPAGWCVDEHRPLRLGLRHAEARGAAAEEGAVGAGLPR